MSPEECIAALDNALVVAGQDIVLRRVVGTTNQVNIDCPCRAMVRAFRLKEEEIVSSVGQAVLLVSISPTDIAKAQWPGGQPVGQSAPYNVDASIPRRNDKVVIQGLVRNIEAVEAIKMGSTVVRINMQVLG